MTAGDAGRIRVLLAEDQAMVRGAISALLHLSAPDIEVVAEAGDGEEAILMAREKAPQVALLDIEMPRVDGLRVAEVLHAEFPLLRIVILTTFARPGYLRRALAAGASGYLLKDAPAMELAAAIRRIARGERVVQPDLAFETLALGDGPLTAREREVLRLADGRTARAIAAELHLSEGTVRNYLSEAIQKLGASTRVDARRIAEERGWL